MKTTNLAGKRIVTKTAALESSGKAFLLPLDFILGWIFTNNRRQRIFNRASNDLVSVRRQIRTTLLLHDRIS